MFIAYLHLASNVFFELCLPLTHTHTHTEDWELGASCSGSAASGRLHMDFDNVLTFPSRV